MIIDQLNVTIHPDILLDIHFNGVFIGILEKPDQRINLFYWNRFLVEIYCQFIHQQWEPVKVNYRLITEAYLDSITASLVQGEVYKLQDAIRNQEIN